MIVKSPQSENTFQQQFTTNSAREAWQLILKSIRKKIGRYPKVLLPSYIGYSEREGSGVFDPIITEECDFVFYPLNTKLQINCKDLIQILEKNYIDVLLVIHYFGFSEPQIKYLKDWCEKNDIILVEDCAHAYNMDINNSEIGFIGDFSFFSIHKYLPTEKGGFMRINNSKFLKYVDTPTASLNSRDLDLIINSNFNLIQQKRISNFHQYQNLLSNIQGIQIMHDLANHEVPHSFPILVENGLREELYFFLLKNSIETTALYYRLISNISKKEFSNSHLISDSILNLPLHQDINGIDIEYICNKLIDFFNSKTIK